MNRNHRRGYYHHFDLDPPPTANDVDAYLGPYSRHEVVQARSVLIRTVRSENNQFWQNIKGKCGILPNGQSIRQNEWPHVWLPTEIPASWFGPVSMVHVIEDDQQAGTSRRNATLKKSDSNHTSSPETICIIDSETEGQNSRGEDEEFKFLSVDSGSGTSKEQRRNVQSHQNGVAEVTENRTGKLAHRSEDSVLQNTSHQHREDSSLNNVNKNKQLKPVGDQDNDFNVLGSAPQREKLETVYMCDICSFIFLASNEAQQHLNTFFHYAASSYLGRKGAFNKHTPVYTKSASVLKCKQGLYNKMVPVCPKCHEVFIDIKSCCKHTDKVHSMNRAYSLRKVHVKKTLVLPLDKGKCTECGKLFSKKMLKTHWKDTNHMPLNVPTKCAAEMSFFVCGQCSKEFYSFLQCKDHVYGTHHNFVGDVNIMMYTLERATSVLHLLPFEPNIKQEKLENTSAVAKTSLSRGEKRKTQYLGPQQSPKRMHLS